MRLFSQCFKIAGLLMLLLGLSACPFPPKIYRMDVQQGNYLDQKIVSQIKTGMTKEKILEILGAPALTHFLAQERWDYYYYLKPGNGAPIAQKSLSLYFKGNKLQRFLEEAR